MPEVTAMEDTNAPGSTSPPLSEQAAAMGQQTMTSPLTISSLPSSPGPVAANSASIESLPIVLLSLVVLLLGLNIYFSQSERGSLLTTQRLMQQLSVHQCETLYAQHQQILQLSADLAARTAEVARLTSQNRSTSQKLSQAERTIVDQRTEFSHKQQELEQESDQFHKTSVSYQRKMGDAHQQTFEKWAAERGSRINLEVQHERLIAAHNTLISQYNDLRDSYASAVAACGRLEVQYNRAVDQIQNVQSAYNGLEARYNQLYSYSSRVASQLDSLSSDYQQLRNNYNQLYYAYQRLGGR